MNDDVAPPPRLESHAFPSGPPPAGAAPAAGAVLSPMVVTAMRDETDDFRVPYVVSVLDRQDLVDSLARTVPEALEQTPGVMVQKTANGQGSPYIRGFTGYRTLAMIDGIRYNNSIYRDGPNEYFSLIDSQSLSGIEVIQGPASVMYGSDAVGGVLFMHTMDSGYQDEASGKPFVHGRGFYRASGAEQSHIGRIDAQTGVGGQWGLHLGVSPKHFGNVDAARLGEQPRTGYDELAWDMRLDARLNETWSITAAGQQLRQDDVWRTHATIFGVSFAGTTVGSDLRRSKDQDRFLSYVKLTGENPWAGVDQLVLTTSLQGWREDGTRIRDNRRREIEHLESGMWGVDLQLQSQTGIGDLTYGMDFYQDRVDTSRIDYHPDGSIRKVHVQGPVGDDVVYGMLGIHVQDRVMLDARTELTIGARFDSVSAAIGKYEDPVTGLPESMDDRWNSLTGSIRASRALDDAGHWRIYGGLSQAFRAPNTADLSRFGASRSSEIETAAAGLDPEHFLTAETGVKLSRDGFSCGFAWFHTWMDDTITSTPTGRVIDGQTEVTKRNSSEGFVHGVETWADWQLGGGFRLFGNLTWLEGEADAFPDATTGDAVREPLSRIQPLTATAGLRWTEPGDAWWLEISGTAAARADKLNSADRADTQRIPPDGTPGYLVLNLRGAWEVRDHVTLHAGLENILDQAYRSHGSGSNEPGFGATVGVDVRF